MQDLNYPERLSILKLQTLERRRLTIDLAFTYNIVHGLVAGSPEDYGLFLATNVSTPTRGNDFKLSVQYSRCNIRKWYFANLVCKVWNTLDNVAVHAPTLASFKRHIF